MQTFEFKPLGLVEIRFKTDHIVFVKAFQFNGRVYYESTFVSYPEDSYLLSGKEERGSKNSLDLSG